MLLLRTYHDDDFLAVTQLVSHNHEIFTEDELRRLKSLLTSNYVIICEMLGKVVGFTIFFCEQGHIFAIYADHPNAETEIFNALIHRIEEKSHELHLEQLTLRTTPNYYSIFTNLGFSLSTSSPNNLIKKLS